MDENTGMNDREEKMVDNVALMVFGMTAIAVGSVLGSSINFGFYSILAIGLLLLVSGLKNMINPSKA